MVGKSLSHYKIVGELASGGMGKVYVAEDTTLGRKVALKILPRQLAESSERRLRFEREAKAVAALNHPNIVTIYSVENADDVYFLTMELVQGKTLSELIPKSGMPLERFFDVAVPLADALSAVHQQGIIHRDLKPDNLMVTEEGRLKILDFGLAKLKHGWDESVDSALPTKEVTQEGRVLGTVAYMSPEQAEGKPVDHRSDIFSVGIIFYQMLTGMRPFHGDSAASVISSILRDSPAPPSDLNPEIPHAVSLVLKRLLAKDVTRRYQNALDLRNELEDLRSDVAAGSLVGGGVSVSSAPHRVFPRTVWALLAVLLIGTGAFIYISWPGPGTRESLTQITRMTYSQGLTEWPSWSPDGSLLAFASNRSGNFEIYVRRVHGGQDVNVTDHPGEDIQPAISPDGEWIAFVSLRSSRTGLIRIADTFSSEFRTYGGDIWVVPALGGRARRLAQDGNFPTWHPDGKSLAYVSGFESHRSMLEVSLEGGEPTPILGSESSEWEIVRLNYAPSGDWITFDTFDDRVMVIPSAGGEPRELLEASSHAWNPNGENLFYLSPDRSGAIRLHSIKFDNRRGEIAGEPQTLGVLTGLLSDLIASGGGHQLAVTELVTSLNLCSMPLDPVRLLPTGPEEVLNPGQVVDHFPAFSPEGKLLAFQSNRLELREIWILELQTKRQERLRLPGEDLGASQPHWSPDGSFLSIVRYGEGGQRSLWLVAVDGSTAEEVVPPMPVLTGGAFSPDGDRILFEARKDSFKQLFCVDLATRRTYQVTESPADTYEGAWSPDGHWIASICNEGGAVQLRKISFPEGEEQILISSPERLRHVFFSPDGRWIFVQPSHRNLHRVPAEGGPLEKVTTFPTSGLYLDEAAISPDGRQIAYTHVRSSSAILVLTLGSPQ